jgi:hypothetical protein
MKKQFLILISIVVLTACTNKSEHVHIAESDNISRETRIDTLEFQDIDSGTTVTIIDTTYFETEVKDAVIYVRMSNGQNYEFNTLQHTVNVEIEEYKNTRSFTTDLYKPCE